jgi:hypothetical protein
MIRTSAGSQAEIRTKDGHRMALRERTTLKIQSAQAPETKFELIIGRARAFVSKLKGRNKFEVKTPLAVASVRGTVFELEVGENQISRLSVLEGVVGYRDLAGLGSEVQVLKGQSVVIEQGSAPRPPEPLPAEIKEGLAPQKEAPSQIASALKAEIQREAGLSSFKEFLQVDAAAEMREALYQEGKTVIDAFGKRVRLEQYITRPAANEFSYVALNTRDDRFDFTRFDLYAHSALPEDLRGIRGLYSSNSHDSMTNWVEKTHRLSSNGGDYYREWQDGGSPRNMTDGTQQVIFSDWYVEVKGDGASPTLLSHWKPDSGFLAGNKNATLDRDAADSQDGFLNIPFGYKLYGSGTQGDDRPIDSAEYTNARRLDYFNDTAVASAYALSEGYSRTGQVFVNDKAVVDPPISLAEFLKASKFTVKLTYDVPGTTSDVSLQTDRYYLTDEGRLLNMREIARLGNDVQGVNFENVFTSSLLGNRKIDVVVSPSILKKVGLLDN